MVRQYVESPKKPIEAIQISEANLDDALAFCPEIRSMTKFLDQGKPTWIKISLSTPNGRAEAMDGDYILKNPDGSFDTMKKEAFEDAFHPLHAITGQLATRETIAQF